MNQTNSASVRILRRAAGAAIIALPVLAGLCVSCNKTESAKPEPGKGIDDPTGRDLERLSKVDPKLIHYHEEGRIQTGIAQPSAIATDALGTLLAAGDNVVRLISPGNGVKEIAVAGTPSCLAIAQQVIYVGLTDRVETYTPEGRRIATWTLAKGTFLTGIAVSVDGKNVYLADSGHRVVLRTDLQGKVINEIGKPDKERGIPGLNVPSPHLRVAAAADGTIWVNNTGLWRMENYSPDGTLEKFWGTSGPDIQQFVGCCNPTDFLLLPDGSFITAEKSVLRVKHYLPDGRFDSVVAAPDSFGKNINGLQMSLNPDGRVTVLELGTGAVHVFALSQVSGLGGGT
jgi:hypothetical protein